MNSCRRDSCSCPLVSIGIPTFNRPRLLRRALESVLSQDYCNLEIIVSDNCSATLASWEIATDCRERFPALRVFRQNRQISPADNLLFLLDNALGEYFMWLADDDEIAGAHYVTDLVQILNSNADTVTSFGNWILEKSEGIYEPREQRNYGNRYWWMRVLKFMWAGSDEIFYGLHRTSALRACRFLPLWSVAGDSLQNTAYPFLLQLVLNGRVLRTQDPNTVWINHDVEIKHYPLQSSRLRYPFRRASVHTNYLRLVAESKGRLALFFFAPFSLLCVTRDLASLILRALWRHANSVRRSVHLAG